MFNYVQYSLVSSCLNKELCIWLFLWSDLCTNGQDFVRDDKARHGIKRIRWFRYFMVTYKYIYLYNTPSVYWSQDISLSIYDDDFMFVIIYPKDSLLQLYKYKNKKHTVCTWNDQKIPQLLPLTQKESRKNLFLWISFW